MLVTHIVLYSYVIGWTVASICLALTARRATVLVVAAGAFWPLLVAGAAQFATVALITELVRRRRRFEHGSEYSDEELHALIDEWRLEFEQRSS